MEERGWPSRKVACEWECKACLAQADDETSGTYFESQQLIVHPNQLFCAKLDRRIEGRKVGGSGLSFLLRVEESVCPAVVDLRGASLSTR